MKVCLELSIFILEQSGSVYVQSQVSPRSVSGLAALLTHFVIQSEPKILRLVERSLSERTWYLQHIIFLIHIKNCLFLVENFETICKNMV